MPSVFQNDSACLPSGLACYKNEVKLSQDDCSVLPCTGIYADVVKHGAEDLPMDKHVKHVLVKYREYKAGFNYDPGKLLGSMAIEKLTTFCTELEQEKKLHMVRIRFGTFKLVSITRDAKAKWIDKVSHFGGTAGLFNGFVIIAIFEFIPLGIDLILQLCKSVKNKRKKPNVVKVKESEETNCPDIMNLLDDMAQNFEALENMLHAINRESKKKVEIHFLDDLINEKIVRRTTGGKGSQYFI